MSPLVLPADLLPGQWAAKKFTFLGFLPELAALLQCDDYWGEEPFSFQNPGLVPGPLAHSSQLRLAFLLVFLSPDGGSRAQWSFCRNHRRRLVLLIQSGQPRGFAGPQLGSSSRGNFSLPIADQSQAA